MQLKVLLPTHILFDQPAAKIIAEATHGAFCLLPHHIDCLAALMPGILTVQTPDGAETFIAVDGGLLTKCGPEVLVSTRHAVAHGQLSQLKQHVEQHFITIDEQERLARSAIARMEAGLMRQFVTLAAEKH
ncbi:MAG: F0F1 ATP synthase subunit epsilon [Elainellaceae cyanobacterium]